MNLEIKEIKEGLVWNNFVKNFDFPNALSSWEWIEFEKNIPFGIYLGKDLKGVFAFRVVNSKKGKYMFLRHSIFFDFFDKDIFNIFISFLKTECKKKGLSFFRISPSFLYNDSLSDLFTNYGFKKSLTQNLDGHRTLILDLSKSLDDILKDMRKNTRYLIKKGERMGVKVIIGNSLDLELKEIYEDSVVRNNWKAYSFDYIREQFDYFSKKGFSKVFLTEFKNKVFSFSVFTKFNNQVIYHHSASLKNNDVPVNYVLIWEAIKYYKNLGIKEFNFFGVSEKGKSSSWDGFSLFKRGFGGQERLLINSYDFKVSNRYFLFRFLEFIKSFIAKRF